MLLLKIVLLDAKSQNYYVCDVDSLKNNFLDKSACITAEKFILAGRAKKQAHEETSDIKQGYTAYTKNVHKFRAQSQIVKLLKQKTRIPYEALLETVKEYMLSKGIAFAAQDFQSCIQELNEKGFVASNDQ